MSIRPYRAVLFGVAAIALTAILGGIHGAGAPAVEVGEIDDAIDQSLRTFTSLLSIIEANNATEVDSDTAVYGAIDGMLRTLDPHSSFIRPEDAAQRRQDLQGRYYGLGIRVSARSGKVVIVEPPFPGAPAEKVGLRVGDMFTHVNGEAIEGWNLNDVVNKLKGPKGTPVDVTITRPGVNEPMEFTIIRDEITSFSITNKFEVRDGIGYIRLANFAETTGQELRDALRDLDAPNLDGLILDLRANPGGALPAAIEVAEAFLERGQLVVETQGRTRNSNREFESQRENLDNHFPLVVLINESSASASEIVAGAIQDHDRGLIVGQTSFGKGLVQSLLGLSKQAILTLTTQKWYTPSGRLIQRDYSAISQFDYYNNREETDPNAPHSPDEIRYSDLGRELYGGGGITPDVRVAPREFNDFETMLTDRLTFVAYVQQFLEDNPSVNTSFSVTDEMVSDFAAFAQTERGVEFTDEDLGANLDFVKRQILIEVIYNRLGDSEANRIRFEDDPQILKAIELIPEARALALEARASRGE